MKKICVATFVILLALGCSQKPSFPLQPSITFNKISVKTVSFLNAIGAKETKDSVSITISYKDGDGDLGVENKDIKEKFNFIVKRLVRVKGVFKPFDPVPSHSGNFIKLKNSKPGPIKGDLNYAIEFPPLKGTKKDTVKFEIQIMDSAGNPSNTVMTDSVLVYELNKAGLK
jgi:hypothetical protein